MSSAQEAASARRVGASSEAPDQLRAVSQDGREDRAADAPARSAYGRPALTDGQAALGPSNGGRASPRAAPTGLSDEATEGPALSLPALGETRWAGGEDHAIQDYAAGGDAGGGHARPGAREGLKAANQGSRRPHQPQATEPPAGRSPSQVTASGETARRETAGAGAARTGSNVEPKPAPAEVLGGQEAAGWRQYLAQADGASPGLVQSAARQAAGAVQAQIVQQAQYVRRNGQSEVTVQLHPPEMGRMKVAVELREGKLEVTIKVENPHVRQAMQAELESLGKVLREGQLDLVRLEVADYEAGPRDGGQEPLAEDGQRPAGQGQAVGSRLNGGGPGGSWARFTESGGVDCLV
jgi:hypothetical protein